MRLSELEIPDTPACRASLEVATAYCSPALLNHSVRAYLWAAGYAATREIAFDAELLYVSAMLHDLALVKEFDNHSVPFEEAGGHVAKLRESLATKDARTFERSAHTLKGSCGNLGAQAMSRICADLQTVGHEANWARAAELLPTLEEEFKAVTRELEVEKTR